MIRLEEHHIAAYLAFLAIIEAQFASPQGAAQSSIGTSALRRSNRAQHEGWLAFKVARV
jgi:hypothetical protein